MISKWISRTIIGIRGLFLWLKAGYPFALLVLIILGAVLIRGSNWFHIWVILILGVVLIVAEMLNTAIERLCDMITPGFSGKVKAIKDICAGAVLVSGVILLVVGGWIIWA